MGTGQGPIRQRSPSSFRPLTRSSARVSTGMRAKPWRRSKASAAGDMAWRLSIMHDVHDIGWSTGLTRPHVGSVTFTIAGDGVWGDDPRGCERSEPLAMFARDRHGAEDKASLMSGPRRCAPHLCVDAPAGWRKLSRSDLSQDYSMESRKLQQCSRLPFAGILRRCVIEQL